MGSEEAILQIQIAKAAAITKAAAVMFTEPTAQTAAYEQAKHFADNAFKNLEKDWDIVDG